MKVRCRTKTTLWLVKRTMQQKDAHKNAPGCKCSASQERLLLDNMRLCGKACHTAPLLLSPSLRERVMSTSTTPMSSSRLFGSSRRSDSSLTLLGNKRMNGWVNKCISSMILNAYCAKQPHGQRASDLLRTLQYYAQLFVQFLFTFKRKIWSNKVQAVPCSDYTSMA